MTDVPPPRPGPLGDRATALMRRARRRTLADGDRRWYAPVPAAELARLTLDEVTHLGATRRSIRRYTGEPVPRPAVLDVCRAGTQSVVTGPTDGDARWLVFARAVTRTAPAIYEYRDGDLVAAADLPAAETMAGLATGPFPTAPCIVTPVWDLGRALVAQDVDGYLNLLVRTGAGLHSAYLAAVRAGLGGCLFRGPHPATFATTGGWGGLDARPFLALALGWPVAEDDR